MNIQWNKVTWYSKLIAVILFVATFCLAFYLGRQYEAAQQLGGIPSRYELQNNLYRAY